MITVPPPVKTQGRKGRPPNVFVDEETFNAYRQRFHSFSMEIAFAYLEETRDAANAVGQFSVAEKIVYDMAKLFGANIKKDASVTGPLKDHAKKRRHRTPSYMPLTETELAQEDAYARLEELRTEASVKHHLETARRVTNDIFRLVGLLPGKITTLDSISENDAALARKINANRSEAQGEDTANDPDQPNDTSTPPSFTHPKGKQLETLTAELDLCEELYTVGLHINPTGDFAKLEKRIILLEEKLYPILFEDYPEFKRPITDLEKYIGKTAEELAATSPEKILEHLRLITSKLEAMDNIFSANEEDLPFAKKVDYYVGQLHLKRCAYRLKHEDAPTRQRREACGLSLFTPFHLFNPPDSLTSDPGNMLNPALLEVKNFDPSSTGKDESPDILDSS